MPNTRRLAVSYSRFSDPKQAKGDSAERQDDLFRTFCQAHNLTPLREVFADRGRSGYKDEHRKKGRLGQLVAAAKDGRFEPGTVVVVEAWDRLGRLRPDRQTDLVAELLRTGVSIGVCRLGDIFEEEDFGSHKWTTLAVFIQMAFQESKQKAERVAASWDRRRQRARKDGELLTRLLPAWLEMGPDDKPRLIPERAAAVRRMFQLSAAGYGVKRIIETLIREDVQPFGEKIIRPERSRSQFAGKWTRAYIALLLRDRRVLGEFQPRKLDHTPEGTTLVGYYPAAVSEEEFLLARAGQESRRSKDATGRASGPRQRKYVNVFRGLLTHARDGEGFVLHNKGTAKEPELILVNASGMSGHSRCYTFPYPIFEEAILRLLREVDARDVLPQSKQERSRVDVLRAKLKNIRDDMERLQEELKAGFSKAIVNVLRDREAAEEEIGKDLQDELARSAKPASRAWKELPGLAELVQSADDPDEVRLRLRSLLRRLVEDVRVLMVRRGSWQLLAAQVFFVGGARRQYLIANQSAGNCRKGGWYAKALAEAISPTDLDLRQDAHAAELAADLEALDLSAIQ